MSEAVTPPVWLITGCSSGFGRLLAERLHARGDIVVATARSIQSLREIGRSDESRILRRELDVRQEVNVRRMVDRTIERYGRIDVLVNNAGYGYFGTQEEGELDEIRAMYETNVFGLISVTQAVLPSMRERRSGTVVNISSIGGRIATPRAGFYHSTKWAVEAISEALHLETHGFGIRVVVVEPGSFDTDFGPRSARRARADDDPNSPYARLTPIWRERAARHIFVPQQHPGDVVDGILEAVASDLPFVRLPIGRDATTILAQRQEMGDAAFVEWMRQRLGEAET